MLFQIEMSGVAKMKSMSSNVVCFDKKKKQVFNSAIGKRVSSLNEFTKMRKIFNINQDVVDLQDPKNGFDPR